MKENCWDFKGCGKGPKALAGVTPCPVATEKRLHKMHGGINAGRSCWVIAGTYCGGKVQGSFAKKYDSCSECDFYHAVKKEEKDKYEMSIVLLNKLKAFEK